MIKRWARRGAVAAAFGVFLVSTALGGVAAAADQKMELKARQAFASGKYDQALELFASLYAETLHPVYLRNIGRCHQKMRQPQKAIDTFRDYLAKAKKISADERKEIDGYIKEMEALRDEQARAEKPPEPTRPPVLPPPMPPPSTGTTTSTTQMTLTTTAPPPSESSPIYTRWWFWTAVGVVVAGGVVTAVMLSSGGTTRPPCGPDIMGGCQ